MEKGAWFTPVSSHAYKETSTDLKHWPPDTHTCSFHVLSPMPTKLDDFSYINHKVIIWIPDNYFPANDISTITSAPKYQRIRN